MKRECKHSLHPGCDTGALKPGINNEYFLQISSYSDADTEGYSIWKCGHVILTLVNVQERTGREGAMVFAGFLRFRAVLLTEILA